MNFQTVSQKSPRNTFLPLVPWLLASMPWVRNEAASTLAWSLWPLTPDWALGSSLLFPTLCSFPWLSPHQNFLLSLQHGPCISCFLLTLCTGRVFVLRPLGSTPSSREVTRVSGQKQGKPSCTFSIVCPRGRWLVTSVSKSYWLTRGESFVTHGDGFFLL